MPDSQVRLTNRPDLAILLAAAYRAVADRLLRSMEEGGLSGMRPLYGFVIRAVAAESPTISRLAELLDVTKQAASQLADDMVGRGFLARRSEVEDRRRSRLVLSRKGQAVFARARRTSAAMERELLSRCGRADLEAFRRTLTAFVELHGAVDEVRARRARPVRL